MWIVKGLGEVERRGEWISEQDFGPVMADEVC